MKKIYNFLTYMSCHLMTLKGDSMTEHPDIGVNFFNQILIYNAVIKKKRVCDNNPVIITEIGDTIIGMPKKERRIITITPAEAIEYTRRMIENNSIIESEYTMICGTFFGENFEQHKTVGLKYSGSGIHYVYGLRQLTQTLITSNKEYLIVWENAYSCLHKRLHKLIDELQNYYIRIYNSARIMKTTKINFTRSE